jgi:hypothetical protein
MNAAPARTDARRNTADEKYAGKSLLSWACIAALQRKVTRPSDATQFFIFLSMTAVHKSVDGIHAVPNIPLATPGDFQLGLKVVPSV